MKKLLLLMVAACMTLAIGAQGTKFNGKIQPKKARTEMSVAKRNIKQTKAAKFVNNLKANGRKAITTKNMFNVTGIRKAAAPKSENINLTAGYYMKLSYGTDWVHELITEDESIEFVVDVLGETMVSGKTYTSANDEIDLYYTGISIEDEESEYGAIKLAAESADFTWTRGRNGEIDVVAHITTTDGDKYSIEYHKGATPTPTSKVTATFENDDVAFADYSSSYGLFQFEGISDEVGAVILCYSLQLEGTYDISQFNSSYIVLSDDTEVEIIDGTVTVTIEDGLIICHAEVIGDNSVLYDLTFIIPDKGDSIEYDATEDFYYSFDGNDYIDVDDQYLSSWGVAYIDAESASCDLYATLEFNLEEPGADYAIPEGVYPINGTMDYGTVTASEGVDEAEGYITGSYVVSVNDEGYAIDPMWFMVDGTVTVKYQDDAMLVAVNAINSNGNSIEYTIVYKEAPHPDLGDGLVYNGGFEEWKSATEPTGWTGWQIADKANTASATISQSTDSHSGNYSCYVEGASTNKRLATQKMHLPADTYIVEFYAKTEDGGQIKPGYATSVGGNAIYEYGDFANAPIELTSSWKRYTYEFTLEEDTEASMLIMNYKNSGDCLIDDYVLVTKSYAEGISNIESNKADNRLFNLAGQVVGNDYKGIVISGGKKFLKK